MHFCETSRKKGFFPLLSFVFLVLALDSPPASIAQQSLDGQVLDRQGKPLAGARVVHVDRRRRSEGTTDADGHFTVEAAFVPPGFLFVQKEGFRFYGHRQDQAATLKITLARRGEPVEKPMKTLSPAMPRAQRKELAAKLLDPYLKRVLEKGDDDSRLRPLEILGKLDASRLLEELEKKPYKNAWYDSYLKRAAALSLLAESFDEARTVVDSMKDAGFRSTGYLDLYDSLPDSKRAEKLALLNQSLLHSRNIQENDHRVIQLTWIARRLWTLGEKERATQLLREGQAIAKELPTAAWAGYARGAFAEDLALIDLPAALQLMKDLKDPFEYVRHHSNLAHKLAGINPAEAERISGFNQEQYAPRVCYRMAPADLPRARKIADALTDPYSKARAYGVMAQALAKSKPKEALQLLDHAFDILAKHSASGQDRFNGMYDAAVMGGFMIPIAEQIDPALTEEFFWRTLALRSPASLGSAKDASGLEARETGALALLVVRYDREFAKALIDEAEKIQWEHYSRPNHYLAAAIGDPPRAVALVEKLPEGQVKDSARESVASMLIAEGESIWQAVLRTLGQVNVDDEDL